MDAKIRQFLAMPLTFESAFSHRSVVDSGFHSHATIEIVYHKKGRGTTRFKGATSAAFADSWVEIYPPCLSHDQEMEEPGEDICVHLGVPAGLVLPTPLLAGLALGPVSDPEVTQDFLMLARTPPEVSAFDRLYRQYRAMSLLVRLLEMSLEAPGRGGELPAEAYARQAHAFILARFRDIEHLEEVARHVGASYDYLRHVFKRQYGLSMQQHLMRTRVQAAKRLLVYSMLSGKAIAAQCGFDNERYFCTSFRKLVGMTPASFRERA